MNEHVHAAQRLLQIQKAEILFHVACIYCKVIIVCARRSLHMRSSASCIAMYSAIKIYNVMYVHGTNLCVKYLTHTICMLCKSSDSHNLHKSNSPHKTTTIWHLINFSHNNEYLLCLNDKGQWVEKRVVHWLFLVWVGRGRERNPVGRVQDGTRVGKLLCQV